MHSAARLRRHLAARSRRYRPDRRRRRSGRGPTLSTDERMLPLGERIAGGVPRSTLPGLAVLHRAARRHADPPVPADLPTPGPPELRLDDPAGCGRALRDAVLHCPARLQPASRPGTSTTSRSPGAAVVDFALDPRSSIFTGLIFSLAETSATSGGLDYLLDRRARSRRHGDSRPRLRSGRTSP